MARGIRDIKEQRLERKRKKKRARRAAFLIIEIFVFAILLGAAMMVFKYDNLQINPFGEGEIQVNAGAEKKDYTTLALFGGDSREGVLEKGTHSDTIIIVAIHNKTKEVKMVSVYRDTLAQQMDGSFRKANHAYFVGGPKEAINMLNKNFDLDIQGYVTVDFKVLANAIDKLGGIELDISEAEANEMNRHIRETAKVVGKEANQVVAGKQQVDGIQAVTYARIRKNVGEDYQRTDRQREVISKIVEKAKGTSFSKLNDIVNESISKVSTSLTIKDVLKLASGISKYHMSDSKGFPFEKADGRHAQAGSVVVPLGLVENVEELHAFLYADAEYQVSDVVKTIATSVEESTGYTRADYIP